MLHGSDLVGRKQADIYGVPFQIENGSVEVHVTWTYNNDNTTMCLYCAL